MPTFHGLAAPAALLQLGKRRPETFHGSPLSQMNLSLATGGGESIPHTEPLMNMRAVIRKEMGKGWDAGENEEEWRRVGQACCPGL